MKKTDEFIVNCPNCQTPIAWNESNPYRPFCSERCKLIDLGEWASEEYKIPTNELSEDERWSSDDHSFSN